MYNKFNQDRRNHSNGFNRQSRGFAEEKDQQTFYYSFYYDNNKGELLPLDGIVDSAIKTEIGFGLKDKVNGLAREYELENPPNSPYVSLFFSDGKYRCVSRIYFSGNQEDITNKFLDYLNRIKNTQLDKMKNQNTSGKIRGLVVAKGSDDKVLETLRKYVKAEEFVEYMLG